MSEELAQQVEEPTEQDAGQAEESTAEETPTRETEAQQEETPEEADQRETEKKPWYKKRFDELTAKRYDAERRAERLEQMLHELYTKGPPQKEDPKPAQENFQPTRPKPTRESVDFDDDAYIEAVTDWKLEQAEAKRRHSETLQQQKRQQEQQFQTFEEKRVAVIDAGRKNHPDFEEVVFSLPGDVMTAELAQAVFETETPHEVAYYLGKRPQEAQRISALSPIKKAIELGKIEARLSNPIKRDTQAPPPPTPIGGKGPVEKDPNKMTTEEWMAWREQQLRKQN